jgi:hypothetical protein
MNVFKEQLWAPATPEVVIAGGRDGVALGVRDKKQGRLSMCGPTSRR